MSNEELRAAGIEVTWLAWHATVFAELLCALWQ